jgi:hypothetical protein
VLFELGVATLMVIATVIFHGLGLQALSRLVGMDGARRYASA